MIGLAERLNSQKINANHGGFKCISSLKIGKYSLSIQASKGHYCSPRKNLTDYNLYTSFEMLIMKEDGSDIQLKKSSIIRNYPQYSELIRHYDGGGIFGWVDKDLLEDFINYLEPLK
tara:strand:- start:732 stop:1082 length:351 start_codon:yes stop_codon:yes gene_type:complete